MYGFYGNYLCNKYNAPGYASYDNYAVYPYGSENIHQANEFFRYRDYGPDPFVINIEDAVKGNTAFRTALWTGNHLQVTLNSIDVGEDIGLEIHPDVDQFIRIEQGQGMVLMGDRPDYLNFQRWVYPDYAIIIPAGKWHNVINTGHVPLKLYSIYAPPQHRPGTVHLTRQDAMAAE